MGTRAQSMDLTLTADAPGALDAALAGSVLLAGLASLAGWTTPIVLRITRFGMVAGLAITAWSVARHLGAWFTEVNRS